MCVDTFDLSAIRFSLSRRSGAPCCSSLKEFLWLMVAETWFALKSTEAVSRLLCRSSKLTEGRKSTEPAVWSPDTPFLPPKEKRLWLLEVDALSIEASIAERRRVGSFLFGLEFSLALKYQI